ncbi:GABA-specific permease [Wickerhamiella sorbophila]|uniref:GABA-specific permease n=1 Tax=Wickerhamiella sorbophila TaxID=45607 RepID=A0A2T0FFY0_9ASCO|nr:GABA-specific permease [Wickerhamiella sorbophila]PRT53902.1 GABA-specific permease [Wickerhamiella sorbophila]
MTQTDDELLMNMGYKPELKRQFGLIEVSGFSLSLMSVVPGITAVFTDSLSAGGVGLSWGWFIPCIFIMCVALSIAELSSSMPTAGGLFWWTYKFSPKKINRPLSMLVAYANIFGLIGSICSINNGFAGMILSLPAIEGDFEPSKFHKYGVFCAATITQCLISSLDTSFINRSQWFMIIGNIVLVVLFCIALPVGLTSKGIKLNTAKFVFGDTTNITDWQYGWSWLLTWMAPIWVISAIDGCIHLAEEATNAASVVPFGLISSTLFTWIFGFAVMCIVAAVITHDFDHIINSPTGQPMAQILMDTLNDRWALGLMIFMTIYQYLVGLAIVTATCRLTFSVGRDNALPYSKWFKKVHNGIPVYANILDCVIAILIGLLVLIGPEAAQAVFNIPVSSSGLSWFVPIFMRSFVAPEDDFNPGPFYMGRFWSKFVAFCACVYLFFVVAVLANMPMTKHVDKTNMNYTVVINMAIWIFSLVYYYCWGHRNYHGPQITVETMEGADVEHPMVKMPSKAKEANDLGSTDSTISRLEKTVSPYQV